MANYELERGAGRPSHGQARTSEKLRKKTSERKREEWASKESAAQKMIFIVGPIKCNNALLASYLEPEIGGKCQVFNKLGKIPKRSIDDTRQVSLVLWDCFGKSVDNCYNDYQGNESRLIQQDFLALYNIPPGLGFEERIMNCGAHGFFYIHDSQEQMAKGIRAIFDGELWISRKIMAESLKKRHPYSSKRKSYSVLTAREVEILTMMATGVTNEMISDKLNISPHTVKTHIYNIFKKIDVPNRLQASLWATKNL